MVSALLVPLASRTNTNYKTEFYWNHFVLKPKQIGLDLKKCNIIKPKLTT